MQLPSAWRTGGVDAALVPHGNAPTRLADLLGCAVDKVVTSRGTRGKPLLLRPVGAAYSMAHRAGVSLIAAGWHCAIGVDLELVRDDLPLDDIADTCFTAAEAAWLRTLANGQRALGFTILWTIKEAASKATGQGITGGMRDPAMPCNALLPLLDGAPTLELALPDFTSVQVRQGTIGPAHAVACIAIIA